MKLNWYFNSQVLYESSSDDENDDGNNSDVVDLEDLGKISKPLAEAKVYFGKAISHVPENRRHINP